MGLIQDSAFGGSQGGKFRLRLYVDLISQNTGANTSYLHVYLRVDEITHGSGVWNTGGSSSWSASVDGSNWSGNWNYDARPGGLQSWTLLDTYITVGHDVNGNKTVGGSSSANGDNSPYITTAGGSGSMGLPRLPLAPGWAGSTADQITPVSARLGNELFSYGHGTSVAMRMYYKKTTDGSWHQTSDQGDVGGFNYWTVSGLTPGTQYQYFARMWNNNGDTSDGGVQTFTTLPSGAFFRRGGAF